MNPYLKAKRDQYEALRTEIEDVQTRAVKEGRDFTEDEATQIRSNSDKAKKLYDELLPLVEQETRNNRVTELAGRIAAGRGGGGEMQNLAADGQQADPYGDEQDRVFPLMPSREQIATMVRSLRDENPQLVKFSTAPRQAQHNRAVVTLAGDLGQPSVPLDARDPIEPRRIATAANLQAQPGAGTTGAAFPVFGAGAAGVTAEGVAKTEYSNISPGTATPQIVNVWTDFTRQAAATHLSFETRLRQKLAALVAAREDLLLVTKVLATTGIQVQAPTADPMAQQLLVAAAKVAASDVGAPPDLFAFNPADTGKIFGAGVGNMSPGELAQLSLQLFGMVGYPTNHITAGNALVGAWRASTRIVVGMAPTWMLDPYTEMKNNVITALLEEAVDLAVEEPTGFVNVDLVV